MSAAGNLISYASLSKGWDAGFSGLMPPRGSSNNVWGDIWRYYLLSPCFYMYTEMPYRFLNQPKAEIAYYYYNGGSWVNVAWRTVEGNTGVDVATFGHNYPGEATGDVNDRDSSDHHLWCIYTRRYRNSDYGDTSMYVGSAGIMPEASYNSFFKNNQVHGNPKTSMSINTSYSTSTPYAVVKTVNNELSAATVVSLFNTDIARGSQMVAGSDWRLNTGIH